MKMHRLETCNRRLSELYAKQGRNSRFKSIKERDATLKAEIKQIEQQIYAKKEPVCI
jgi:glutamyl-tRNA reductase